MKKSRPRSTRSRPDRRARLAVLALPLALGCASSQPDPLVEENLRRARSHYELGVDHMANSRPEQGLRELMLATRLDPLNPRIHYALAKAYIFRARWEEVEAHLLRATEIHPEYHEARLDLSTLYIQRGRYEEAIAQSEILIEDPTFPAPWRAYSNRGWAELRLGDAARARRSLEEAAAFNPRYWPVLLNLGILEQESGHTLAAIEHYQRMLDLEPDGNAEAEANYRLGEIYVSLGKRDRAVDHLMAAVARTPNGTWGRKSEEYLKLLR